MKKYIKSAVQNYSNMPDETVAQILKDPNTSPRDLVSIINAAENDMSDNFLHSLVVIQNALLNPNLPEAVLHDYAYKGNDYRLAVIQNPSAPKDILLEEASHPGGRAEVAKNPSLPAEGIEAILKRNFRTDSSRREWLMNLAENPSLPANVFETLINDPKYVIREAAALNPNCPKELKQQFEVSEGMFSKFYVNLNAPCDMDEMDIENCLDDVVSHLGYTFHGWQYLSDICWEFYCDWVTSDADINRIADAVINTLENNGCSIDYVDHEAVRGNEE